MINGSLWKAMNTKQHNLEAAKVKIPEFSAAVCFSFRFFLRVYA
jgi:hypothetical protein